MDYDIRRRRPRVVIQLVLALAFVLTLALTLQPQQIFAQPARHASDGPTIRAAHVGFQGQYQDGNWVPVQVSLSNNGPDFNGKVSVSLGLLQNGGSGNSTYQSAISLPSGSQKQTTLYIPLSLDTTGNLNTLTVNLLDSDGKTVATTRIPLSTINASDINVGILSRQQNGFSPLNGVTSQLKALSPNTSLQTTMLDATSFPVSTAALKNFTMLILDNFTTSTLNTNQLTALESWVQQGGTFIVVGGPEWQQTLTPLPADLLPVSITGTETLPAGTRLLPIGGPGNNPAESGQNTDAVPAPVDVSVATARPGTKVLLSANNTPVFVEATPGLGTVEYLAFDPTLTPLFGWPSTTLLWEGLILRSDADQILNNNALAAGNGGLQTNIAPPAGDLTQLLQGFIPNTSPAIWLILLLLLGYVLILGPIRFILVRRLKKRDWSWRIVLSSILVFTLLSYGLALIQKGTSVVGSSISIVQLSSATNNSSLAHVTNYIGVFVPNQGDFRVHMPDAQLVQAADTNYSGTGTRTTITSQENGTDVTLQGVNTWTMRSIITQKDQRTPGGLTAQLALNNTTITGTVTNHLPYALDDAYLLFENDYLALGHLASGQSHTVNMTLTNSLANANASTNPPASLASQIAADHHTSAAPYNPYGNSQQLTDSVSRRMALLTSLSNGGYCGPNAACPTNMRYWRTTIGGTYLSQTMLHDPLLLPGAAATLIGWADTSQSDASKVTINDTTGIGIQETLVQAPLDMTYASGPIRIFSDQVNGRLIDVHPSATSANTNASNNFQAPTTDMYSMTTGSMTFAYTLPTLPRLQSSTLTLTDSGINAKFISTTGQSYDISHTHAAVYNWQTGKWDSQTFQPGTQNGTFVLSLSDTQPYIGPDGRLLLHLACDDNSASPTVFSKPALQLQGTASN